MKIAQGLFLLAISSLNTVSAKMHLDTLISTCSPKVHPNTMHALISVESANNPLAIAVVKGAYLSKQPSSYQEAVQLVSQLTRSNANFSVGIAQINSTNFKKYAVTAADLLNPCKNLQIAQQILQQCYVSSGDIDKTLSCYYSGNFTRGFKKDYRRTSYVERIYYASAKHKEVKEVFVPDLKKYNSLKIQEVKVSKVLDKEKNDYGQYAFD